MLNAINTKLKVVAISMLSLTLAALIAAPTYVFAAASFQGGDMFKVSNTNSPAWLDPVVANIGDIVEFHLEIVNGGDQTATNVRVQAEFPTNVSGSSIPVRIHVRADNAPEYIENATVNVPNTGTTKNLDYYGGHAVFTRHPGNQQTAIEAIGTGAEIALGDLQVGNSYFLEVQYKARLTENAVTVTPTPTPTVGPTATPTPTPTVGPTATPTPTQPAQQAAVLACPSGLVEVGRNSNQIICFNQQQNFTITLSAQGGQGGAGGAGGSANANATGGNANANASVVAPAAVAAAPRPQGGGTVASVKELPKTGLPLAAWALAGLMPAGLGFKRFGKGNKISETPNFWSQQREFSKE
ncbi:MAG: hypothetical protein Q7S88_01890 [Candidatus Daviesbacteria bacterium]|nr:hypothetical protein [Candidatus Daviesbacteria bacterium]